MAEFLASLSKIFLLVPLMVVERRMYKEAKKTWNPVVGCLHDCSYCKPSFQAQVKRVGVVFGCKDCMEYKPHFHPERLQNLEKKLPKTRGDEFIFLCDTGDWCFAKPEWRRQILEAVKKLKDRTFLIQSKNPAVFKEDSFPENVILGITLETNRDELCQAVSKAPPPSKRYKDFSAVNHPRKIVTVEPIMDFDLEILADWITEISPLCTYIGYNSRKKPKLPEPPLIKTISLIETLEKRNIPVRRKLLRKAWNET